MKNSAKATTGISAWSDSSATTASATGLSPTFTENGSAVTLFSGASASAAESGQGFSALRSATPAWRLFRIGVVDYS